MTKTKGYTKCSDEYCDFLPCLTMRLDECRVALLDAPDFESQRVAFSKFAAASRAVRRAEEEERRYIADMDRYYAENAR